MTVHMWSFVYCTVWVQSGQEATDIVVWSQLLYICKVPGFFLFDVVNALFSDSWYLAFKIETKSVCVCVWVCVSE